jgi:hypothetical protein
LGTFDFGHGKQLYQGTYPMWDGVTINGTRFSTCGVLVRGARAAPFAFRNMDHLDDVGRIRVCFTGVIAHLDYRKGTSRVDMRRRIKGAYVTHFQRYAALDRDIEGFMASPEYDAWERGYMDEFARNFERRILASARRTAYSEGHDEASFRRRVAFHTFIRYARQVIDPVTAAGLGVAINHALNFMPGYRFLRAAAVAARLFAYSFAAYGALRGVFNYETLRVCRAQTCAQIAQPTQPGMVPCAADVVLRKTVVRPERLDTQVYQFGSISSTVPRTVDPPTSTYDVYGTYIPGAAVCTPETKGPGGDMNMEAAFRIRYLQERKVDPQSEQSLGRFARMFIDRMPDVYLSEMKDPFERFKATYGTKKAKRMVAMRSGPAPSHKQLQTIRPFTKPEVYFKELAKMKPRVICPRPEVVVAHLGPEIGHVGDCLKRLWSVSNPLFCYVSGMTPDQVGIRGRMANDMPVTRFSDASNWDGSLPICVNSIEDYYLTTRVKGWETGKLEQCRTLLHGKNFVACDKQLRVRTRYGRASGDLWTSSFNSLINAIITMWTNKITFPDMPFEDFTHQPFTFTCLGDDNFYGMDSALPVPDVTARYAAIGMKCEIVTVSRMEELDFCSGRFWQVDGRYRWGNKPFRTLAKMGVNYYNHPKKIHKRLLLGTAKSLLSTAGHIPILGAILRAIADSGDAQGIKAYHDNRHRNPYRVQGGVSLTPSLDTYEQFSRIYGIDVGVLFEMEDWIDCCINIDSFPMKLEGEVFKQGFVVDTDKPITTQTAHEIAGVDLYDSITRIIPRQEELQKLRGARTIGEALQNARRFGRDEDHRFGTTDHELLHQMFTLASWYSLELGVGMHSTYNRVALMRGFQPCARGRRRRGKKKGSVARRLEQVLRQEMGKKKRNRRIARGVGGAIGQRLAGPVGASLGANAAEYAAKLVGVGEYKVSENTLMNSLDSGNLPVMHSGSTRIRQRAREYVGPVLGSIDFAATEYLLNPNNPDMFPHLAGICIYYSEYRIKGMVVVYTPTSGVAVSGTNPALGSVAVATQYNVLDESFHNLNHALNSEFASVTVPSKHLIHPIECRRDETPTSVLYVRNEDTEVNVDARLYDMARISVITEGMPADSNQVGLLHVCYDVELLKARIPNRLTQVNQDYLRISGTNPTRALPWGADGQRGGRLTAFFSEGSLGVNSLITFPNMVAGDRIMINCFFTVASSSDITSINVANPTNNLPAASGWGVNQDSLWLLYSEDTNSANLLVVREATAARPSFELDLTLVTSPASCDYYIIMAPGADGLDLTSITPINAIIEHSKLRGMHQLEQKSAPPASATYEMVRPHRQGW